jgi:putative thioredoxin
MSLTLDSAIAPKTPSDLIKDSTDQAFAGDVINASKQQPVLVDFWAPWCGPCKTLTPTIEKVVREAKGKVKLVKVNIDENPSIAGQLRVQSIPAVFAFVDGRPVDAFMGALPESQVRQFIDRLSKMGNMAEQIADAMAALRQMFEAKEFESALDVAAQILEADPAQAEASAIKAKIEIELSQLPWTPVVLRAWNMRLPPIRMISRRAASWRHCLTHRDIAPKQPTT